MKLVVPYFSGIAPRFADRLLEDYQASFVTNLKPTNGDLRGFRSLLVEERLLAGSVRRKALKFYYPGSDDFVWFLNEDVNSDAVKSPLASDAFNRVYYTDDAHSLPQLTTLDDINNDVPSVNLGIPRPTNAPTINSTGGVGSNFTAAYTYIYVDEYGSLSAPAPPTIATAKVDSTRNVTFPGSHPSSAVAIDVYRSLAGEETSGSYYKVGRHPSTSGTFVDTIANDVLALQPILDTFNNDPPLAGLKGLITHSSGSLVGFVDRTVAFSLPYLPHAWPEDYRYVVSDEVVGIAAINNNVVVLTKGFTTVLSGNRPDAIAFTVLPDPDPCMSKRSIVTMNNSVIYASKNGLVAVSNNGLSRPINNLMTRDEFERYSPETIVAASYGSYYIAFYEDSRGFAVALPPYEPTAFVPLDRYSAVTGLDTDRRTGDLYVIQTNVISLFDQVADQRFATTFRSKEFIVPKPINFGAFQIIFTEEDPIDEDTALLIVEASLEYNALRYAAGPLDTIGSYPVGGDLGLKQPVDEILGGVPPIQPLGGEPLYDAEAVLAVDGVSFNFFADGILRHSKIVTDSKVYRLPEGYKATRYYLEVSSSLQVQKIIVAETPAECREA